ncbi:hypothetical protein HYV91_02375 [Candidatus Wolfebacteria bacterium]|nr:hypothetical protein [Candidatus Wolfebacteria bacterium]
MQEYKIKIENREYTLNNNSGKYDRVFDQKFNPEFKKGEQLTNEQILAYYDKFGGLILDKNGQEIGNLGFWKAYEEKLTKEKQQKENWQKKKEAASSLVEFIKGFKEVLWFILLLIFLGALFFGYDKIVSVIKDIKDLL